MSLRAGSARGGYRVYVCGRYLVTLWGILTFYGGNIQSLWGGIVQSLYDGIP